METTASEPIRLTQYSHGAGCGCKIAPAILDKILHSNEARHDLRTGKAACQGNDSRDDATVYDIGNERSAQYDGLFYADCG